MNIHTLSSNLKQSAKDILLGNYGTAILILITSEILSLIISSFTTGLVPSNSIPGVIILLVISLIVSTFLGLFELGIACYYLKLCCHEPGSITDLFYGFSHQPNRTLHVSFVLAGISFICNLPANLGTYFLPTDSPMMVQLGVTYALLLVGMILSFLISLPLAQSYFLLLDFPDYTPKQALLGSAKLMKGNMGKLAYIWLSFIPLFLLSLFTCGLALLWVVPYYNATRAQFFLNLMKESATD